MGTGYDAGVSQVSSASILGHSISAEHEGTGYVLKSEVVRHGDVKSLPRAVCRCSQGVVGRLQVTSVSSVSASCL